MRYRHVIRQPPRRRQDAAPLVHHGRGSWCPSLRHGSSCPSLRHGLSLHGSSLHGSSLHGSLLHGSSCPSLRLDSSCPTLPVQRDHFSRVAIHAVFLCSI